MHHIEDKIELGHRADKLGFQEGRPFLLQSALPPEVALWKRGVRGSSARWVVRGEEEERGEQKRNERRGNVRCMRGFKIRQLFELLSVFTFCSNQ